MGIGVEKGLCNILVQDSIELRLVEVLGPQRKLGQAVTESLTAIVERILVGGRCFRQHPGLDYHE